MNNHIYDKSSQEPETMIPSNEFAMLLSNQEEIKSGLKEINSEVKKINGRVTKLETDNVWKQKYHDIGLKLGLVGGGIVLGMVLEWFIMRGGS